MRLRPRNWADFQHYSNRCPPWIRLHRTLLDNFEFQSLPMVARALAPMLWLLASESPDGAFDATPERLAFRLRQPVEDIRAALDALLQADFFEKADDTMLATGQRGACLDTEERRGETEESRNIPPLPAAKARPKPGMPEAYTPEFEMAWGLYPARPGANKRDAFKAWSARIKAGDEPAAIINGVTRYKAYVLASRTQPQYIKQPATFFGPSRHFAEPWDPPAGRRGGDLPEGQNYRDGVGKDGRIF